MKGKYLSMDDAYKIANFDKVNEKCRMLEGNNFELTQKIKKLKKEHEKEVMELKKENKRLLEENYNLKNKQINLEDYRWIYMNQFIIKIINGML